MGFRGKLEIRGWAGIILDDPREYSSTKQGLTEHGATERKRRERGSLVGRKLRTGLVEYSHPARPDACS
jgi:hypothetical protein